MENTLPLLKNALNWFIEKKKNDNNIAVIAIVNDSEILLKKIEELLSNENNPDPKQ